MAIPRADILNVLFESIAELNEQLPPEQHLAPASETPLLGMGGSLDSLGFVNFVAIVEERLEERLGISLVLNDAPPPAGARDPFSTVGNLSEYIELVAAGKAAAWR